MKDDDMEMESGMNDLHTLMEAEGIKKDKKKMKAVMKHAKDKMATIKSIQDLKTAYNAKYGEGRLMREKESKTHEKLESKTVEASEGKDDKEKA
jgi:3-methyladenine DNA glycosylase Tag